MSQKLLRVGTVYIPARNVMESLNWYTVCLELQKAIGMKRDKWP
ncbi:hypothetical protein [Cytobacillus sp.]